MAKIKLTKSKVDDITHPAKGQQYYSDSLLKGFGLRVGANSKTYFAEKRVNGMHQKMKHGKKQINLFKTK